jgi:hypothetical protein
MSLGYIYIRDNEWYNYLKLNNITNISIYYLILIKSYILIRLKYKIKNNNEFEENS